MEAACRTEWKAMVATYMTLYAMAYAATAVAPSRATTATRTSAPPCRTVKSADMGSRVVSVRRSAAPSTFSVLVATATAATAAPPSRQALTGRVRPVSDGALYPALTRLFTAGKLDQHTEPGASAAPRRILSLTDKGREDLLERLRHPKQAEITDHVRLNTVLAFLRHLPDPREQTEVLRRRLEFPETPTSFFYDSGKPVRAEQADDLFRQGMLRVARATGEAERAWLREAIAQLDQPSSARR
jgi:DNA-binding PadR family transcriptional regulator